MQVPIEYFYQEHITSSWDDNSTLAIEIPVPVSKLPSTYDVYSVQTIPIPIDASNTSSMGTTLVTDMPKYLAISDSTYSYIEMSQLKFDT